MSICPNCKSKITCSCQIVKNGEGLVIGCTNCSPNLKKGSNITAPKNNQSGIK